MRLLMLVQSMMVISISNWSVYPYEELLNHVENGNTEGNVGERRESWNRGKLSGSTFPYTICIEYVPLYTTISLACEG